MKHHVISALLLAAGLIAAQANAACDYPVAPGRFPDGGQATKEEMLAAKKSVVEYNDNITAYLACIKSEYDAKVVGQTGATKAQLNEMEKVQNQKHNAAVDEALAVTERFNEQLRAYKAKTASDKKSS